MNNIDLVKRLTHIFLRVAGGLTLAAITAAIMIGPWLMRPEDIDRIIALFLN